jgi:hypothetical protein
VPASPNPGSRRPKNHSRTREWSSETRGRASEASPFGPCGGAEGARRGQGAWNPCESLRIAWNLVSGRSQGCRRNPTVAKAGWVATRRRSEARNRVRSSPSARQKCARQSEFQGRGDPRITPEPESGRRKREAEPPKPRLSARVAGPRTPEGAKARRIPANRLEPSPVASRRPTDTLLYFIAALLYSSAPILPRAPGHA